MNDEPVKVGDTLWFVPIAKWGGAPSQVTVAKIGRKWATMAEGYNPLRMDMWTWRADGGGYSSPGRFYRSREAYEERQALRGAWSALVRALSANEPPEGVDLEWIEAAHKRLGIPK